LGFLLMRLLVFVPKIKDSSEACFYLTSEHLA
jgi:hypothetical protein